MPLAVLPAAELELPTARDSARADVHRATGWREADLSRLVRRKSVYKSYVCDFSGTILSNLLTPQRGYWIECNTTQVSSSEWLCKSAPLTPAMAGRPQLPSQQGPCELKINVKGLPQAHCLPVRKPSMIVNE